MNILGFLRRFETRSELMYRMMEHFGVVDSLCDLPHAPATIRRATTQCAICSQAEHCATWLHEASRHGEPPAYCRNRSLIERLREKTDRTAAPSL